MNEKNLVIWRINCRMNWRMNGIMNGIMNGTMNGGTNWRRGNQRMEEKGKRRKWGKQINMLFNEQA